MSVRLVYDDVMRILVPRALSMQNRNPLSQSYGCFDRNFWHFKTLVDFPSATYQQAVLGLAALWSYERGGKYGGSGDLGEAVRAGALYWCQIQNRDGSFNEYFENDRSFCPTAFTTFSVASVLESCGDLFSEGESDRIMGCLVRAARWLTRHENPSVMNQMIASLLGLRLVADLSGDAHLREASFVRRDGILAAQTPEGWFAEYNGADVGYSYLALDLLAQYLSRWHETQVNEAGERLIGFLSAFLHPDGTAGGHYGSRCTQHVFPYGIEAFASRGSEGAARIQGWMRSHATAGRGLSPHAIDDKYLMYFYFNSFALAFLHSVPDEPQERSVAGESQTLDLPGARVIRIRRGRLLGWIGYGRNGVCRFFDGDTLLHVDSGYVIRTGDGRLCATQVTDPDAWMTRSVEGSEETVVVEGRAGYVDDAHPLVRWVVPFKLLCRTLLRFDRIAYWFHRFIKGRKIAHHQRAPVTVTRRFTLGQAGLVIEDTMKCDSDVSIQDAMLLKDVTTVHSPSSRFISMESLGAAEPVTEEVREPGSHRRLYRFPTSTEDAR